MTKAASESLSSVDVVSVGGLCIDIVLRVDRFPGHDEKVASELVGNLPGGPQPNFACAASTLGLSVRSLSHIGTDEYGEIVKAIWKNMTLIRSVLRLYQEQLLLLLFC
ncbi:MAG: hypothetical protein CM1200mP6_08060 [Anaerolineaceae bacterium]|nr:MAG: hypothetical protein CM1200mP6_08060 [Anaerolineaceae bacterium]